MKEIITIIFIMTSIYTYGQTWRQGLRINVSERTKSADLKLKNTTVDIWINGDNKQTLTTDNDGYLPFIEMPIGKCDVKIQKDSCQIQEIKSIVIGERKTCYISFSLICEEYLKSLSRKERKKIR